MNRLFTRFAGIYGLFLLPLVISSCKAAAVYSNPSDIVDVFYAHQVAGSKPMPEDIFVDDLTRERILGELDGRILSTGEFMSRKKIGSNVQVQFADGGRQETLTYVFKVDCAMGMTRETIVLKRGRKGDSYKISSYQVEHVDKMPETAPMSSQSA